MLQLVDKAPGALKEFSLRILLGLVIFCVLRTLAYLVELLWRAKTAFGRRPSRNSINRLQIRGS
jgi:hypothetical protein